MVLKLKRFIGHLDGGETDTGVLLVSRKVVNLTQMF